MDKFGRIKNEFIQLTKYGIISIVCTSIDFLFFALMTQLLLVHYLVANFISYSTGLTINYFLNKNYNFKSKTKKVKRQFASFATISLIGLSLNMYLIYLFVEHFKIWEIYAKVISIFIVFIWNYLGHKFIAFKQFE